MLHTVFVRLNIAAFIKLLAFLLRRLFERVGSFKITILKSYITIMNDKSFLNIM